ncbi:MAG: hypothetical protein OXJ55_08765 [Caldilineaceae bacterium]|nr:hypothetical protein [Caldilineaceae bacterium]MDE0461682.1 hypothetical protein [Caldilineaceae bacterium]MDE0462996.1 hypothetical protein [Caldilineaceae bacterium]
MVLSWNAVEGATRHDLFVYNSLTARVGNLQLEEAIPDCLLEGILNEGERVVVVGTGVGQNREPRGDFNQGACTLNP